MRYWVETPQPIFRPICQLRRFVVQFFIVGNSFNQGGEKSANGLSLPPVVGHFHQSPPMFLSDNVPTTALNHLILFFDLFVPKRPIISRGHNPDWVLSFRLLEAAPAPASCREALYSNGLSPDAEFGIHRTAPQCYAA
ncbi:MAG: hypothetical protein WDN06_11190 [Asticcacaulis sp.]